MKKVSLFFVLVAFSLQACNETQKSKSTVSATKTDPSLAIKTADVFEEKFGTHQGKRRNHIDGFCFSGHLTMKDRQISQYSKSAIFSEKPLKVAGRFSHKGGVKKDESTPGEYGMAFEVFLEDGTSHKFSMNTLDFFPVNSPEGFLQLMQAKVSGKAEDFAKLKEDHAEFKNYKAHYGKKKSSLRSYPNHQFNSVNTFILENDAGKETPVRWSFIPQNDALKINTEAKVDFFAETQKSLNNSKELVWEMLVTIANKNDKINDASVMWQGEHQQLVAATLTIDEIMKQGACDHTNFDPLHLQPGIKPSNDPVLKFRSPAYAASFGRRLKEVRESENSSK